MNSIPHSLRSNELLYLWILLSVLLEESIVVLFVARIYLKHRGRLLF